MAVLIGAIAYRRLPAEDLEIKISSWKRIRDHKRVQQGEPVNCPKCGETYILVEGVDATDETEQEDLKFLAKALSAVHPRHAAQVFVRDPDGVLHRIFGPTSPVSGSGEETETDPHFAIRGPVS